MKRMYRLLIILMCFFSIETFAQNEAAIWYFGEKAGLDFTSGSPVSLFNSAMSTTEGSASIADKQGNILFYTNGTTVWNRLHKVMENGSGLNGNVSSTQSAIIIPHPGADSLYYVFVADNHGSAKGVSYSIVNIDLNNGLGKVTRKNVQLTGSASEKLTAVHHCNNRDVWLITRLWNSDRFYSFFINKNGLDVDPVISFSPYNLTGHEWGTLGSMKVSPDSRKLAAAHGWSINYIEIGNFDRSTGTISNVQKLSVAPPGYTGFETGPYGIEFSSDSRYLYVYAAYGGSKSWIYQFDLSLPTITDIQNSRRQVAELNYPYAGSLQLATDQKIYVTDYFDSSLSVIHQPNNAVPACNFEFGAIPLGRRVTLGLPNYIQSFNDPNFGAGDFSARNCETNNLDFIINRPGSINSVKWDFGDPASGALNSSTLFAPTHTYPSSGFYNVVLIAYRSCSVDTIRKKIYSGNLPLNLFDNYQGCNDDSLRLSVPFYAGLSYRWSNGARTSFTDVTTDGKYKVTITAGCSFGDSTLVTFYDKPVFSLGPDKTICTGDQVLLNPAVSNARFQWNTGDTSQQLRISSIGTYWVNIRNLTNTCSGSDTIIIKDKPFPPLFLGKDTLVCETEELLLKTGLGSDNSDIRFTWQDGTTASVYKVKGPGYYFVRASNNCTIKMDTIQVTYKTCPLGIPNAFTPNGDGRNDRFRAKYGSGISKYRLRIFNRFGQLVFESADQLNGWDGSMAGKNQPAGTYAWYVQYTDVVSGKPVLLKGTVTLIR